VEPAPPAAGTRKKRNRKKTSRNQPNFDLAAELKRVAGVDLTRIDGIQVMTIQTIITEAGLDMSQWPTEHHFVSWIGLAPRPPLRLSSSRCSGVHDSQPSSSVLPANEISGGKVLKKRTRKVVSRLATALRMAASTLRESESYLGAQFRRLRSRLGSPKAITAMAAKQARLVYRMLKHGQEYVDKGTALYEEKYRQQKIKFIARQAARQGFALVPLANPG
jgi:transposase